MRVHPVRVRALTWTPSGSPSRRTSERTWGSTRREQCWWDEWDEGALRNILAQQKKITQQSKQLGMKKL